MCPQRKLTCVDSKLYVNLGFIPPDTGNLLTHNLVCRYRLCSQVIHKQVMCPQRKLTCVDSKLYVNLGFIPPDTGNLLTDNLVYRYRLCSQVIHVRVMCPQRRLTPATSCHSPSSMSISASPPPIQVRNHNLSTCSFQVGTPESTYVNFC